MEPAPPAPPPGLKWRRRKDGGVRAIWVAQQAAVAAGFPVKTVNLTHLTGDPAALRARCEILQAEMRTWISGRAGYRPEFDGTFGTLLALYETDPDSTFHKLKPTSARPYGVYLRKLKRTIGARRIDAIDGRDLNRWFETWAAPDKPDGKKKLAAAAMAMNVLKSATSFGIVCRRPGCAELMTIMDELEFPRPRSRRYAPAAKEITAARAAAHRAGRPLRALAYALQFETTLRQYDVVGQWVPLSDPRPSAVLGYGEKWLGPSWSQVDGNLIFRLTPGKTEDTTEVDGVYDLKIYPMVMEELAHIPREARVGPIILNEATGQPYRDTVWREGWREDADAAEIPKHVWNRDLRAGGITEGGKAGAKLEDRAKQAGHAAVQTTARVYDRERLEAQRRVSRARNRFRKSPGT